MQKWAWLGRTTYKLIEMCILIFNKATMDNFVKMEFCPGTPTANLATVEQVVSILV
jgi:hypothetical protein